MRWMALLALLLLLAGCLEDAPAADLPADDAGDDSPDRQGRGGSSGDEDADSDAIFHYEQSFGLVVNPEAGVSVGIGGVTEANCVLFWDTSGSDYTILNGTAVMAWDPTTPAAEPLAVYVTGGQGPSASGSSPVTLAFQNLDSDGWGLGFAADSALGSAPVMQEVTLSLAFDYRGDLPSPGTGQCSNGFP